MSRDPQNTNDFQTGGQDQPSEDGPSIRRRSRRRPWRIPLLVGGGVALLLVGLVVWLTVRFSGNTPTRSYSRFQEAVRAKAWGEVYDRLDSDSKEAIPVYRPVMKEGDEVYEVISQDDGRTEFIARMTTQAGNSDLGHLPPADWQVVSERIDGNSAVLTVTGADGQTARVVMVYENREWRLSLPLTLRERGPPRE